MFGSMLFIRELNAQTENYTIIVSISGLPSGHDLCLQINNKETSCVSVNSDITFFQKYGLDALHSVTVSDTPIDVSCLVNHGNGTINKKNIINVEVKCSSKIQVSLDLEKGQEPETEKNKDMSEISDEAKKIAKDLNALTMGLKILKKLRL